MNWRRVSPAHRELAQAKALIEAHEARRAEERRAAQERAALRARRWQLVGAFARWIGWRIAEYPGWAAAAVLVLLLWWQGILLNTAVTLLTLGGAFLVARTVLRHRARRAARLERERLVAAELQRRAEKKERERVAAERRWAALQSEPTTEAPPDPRTVELRRLLALIGSRKAVQLETLGEELGMTPRAVGEHVRGLGLPVVKVMQSGQQRRGVKAEAVRDALRIGTEAR